MKNISETREALNDLETRMDGFGGRNWRDEYPGYEHLSTARKIEVLIFAIAEHEN
jgi:hypothetical protein